MEWRLHIAGEADLARPEPATLAELRHGAAFTGYAYGTEFCENLLPDADTLRRVREAVGQRGFTFLTPYVGDAALQRLRTLLNMLRDGDEVVFADWGVLRMLMREFPELQPVQGRLLNKAIRDPRIMGQFAESALVQIDAVSVASREALQQGNLGNTAYTKLLQKAGVRMAEFDVLPQGNRYATGSPEIGVGIYAPFRYISTARVCEAAGLGYRTAEKFQPAAPCRHECQTFVVEYTYENSPFANRDEKFWLQGNTYFHRHSEAETQSIAAALKAGHIQRITLQAELPMYSPGVQSAPRVRRQMQRLVTLPS
jgi:hypothetical protein